MTTSRFHLSTRDMHTYSRKIPGNLLFLSAVVVAIALYVPFLSQHYDLNGLVEASAVEGGVGLALFTPHHMLFRPVGYVLLEIWRWLGHDSDSLVLLQTLTALCGAIGIGLAALAFERLAGRSVIAWVSAAMLGTSWAYWVYGTDISYNVPSAMPVAGALAFLSSSRPTYWRLGGSAIFGALAVLVSQANVFVLPALAVGAFLLERKTSHEARARHAAVLLLLIVTLVGLAYLTIGVLVAGKMNPVGFVQWATSYETGLPQWGTFAGDRIPMAVVSAIGSFVPVWSGLGLRSFLQGSPDPSHILSLSALLALGILSVASVVKAVRGSRNGTVPGVLVLWLVASYALYFLFIVWWEPFEPKWFLVPNIFLAAAFAIIWASVERRRVELVIVGGCVLVIAAANFAYTVWPRHVSSSPEIELADCVARNVRPTDLVISADWTWIGYVSYLHHRDALSLLDLAAARPDELERLSAVRQEIARVQSRGGTAYITDVRSYSPEYLAWFTAQTSLTRDELSQLGSQLAFSCTDMNFLIARIK